MCGLAGRFGPPAPAPWLRTRVDAMARALHHRGPDGTNVWTAPDGRAAVAHTRLAVVAVSANTQPATSADGHVLALLNGELYGWRELASTLRQRGHVVADGDAAILPALWTAHGPALVHELRGEFAIAILDLREGELFLARDRFGVKPLVYAQHEGALWFASEAKALFAAGLPAAWDPVSVGHAFAHQYLPPDRTFFEGVHSLAPGHLLTARIVGDGLAASAPRLWGRIGWAAAVPPMADAAADVAAGELLSALRGAVSDRLVTERPLGVHLSGGIDSAIVLALATEAVGPVPAYTLRFPGADHDEGALAAAIARHTNARLTEVRVDHDQLLGALPAAVRHAEGLCINGQLAGKHLLNQAVRADGTVVVLSGEGSDELFLGYPHLLLDAGVDSATLSPSAGRQRGLMLPEPLAPRLPACDAILGYTPAFLAAKSTFGRSLLELCREDFAREVAGRDPLRVVLTSLADQGELEGHRAHVSSVLWSRLCLAGYILRMIGDGQEMAFGVEGRPPFLDDRVLAVARTLPVAAQLPAGKAVLRRAARDLLPPEVCARPKHPFLAPSLMATLREDTRRRGRVRDALADGAGRVVGLDRTRLLDWYERAWPNGSAPADDAILHTTLSAIALAATFGLTP